MKKLLTIIIATTIAQAGIAPKAVPTLKFSHIFYGEQQLGSDSLAQPESDKAEDQSIVDSKDEKKTKKDNFLTVIEDPTDPQVKAYKQRVNTHQRDYFNRLHKHKKNYLESKKEHKQQK